MRNTKRPELNEVIEDVYDAALDSGRWTQTIGKIVGFVGGHAGGLALKDSVRKDVNVFYDVGFEPECIQVYLADYSRFDPLAIAPLFCAGRVASVPDLMPYDEYLKGRFYREWARPQGWLDSANAIIEKSGATSTLLRVVTRKSTGLVDNDMRHRMAQVVPHVRRAALVGKSIELKNAEAAMLAETLDRLSAGLFLVDAKGRVVHANVAAREILAADDFLRSVGGRLVTRDERVNQSLRDIFSDAADGDGGTLGTRGTALRLKAHDGERYALHVLPLNSGERRRAGIVYAATAAVFVRKTSMQTPSSAEVVALTYKLTRTELRVLLTVVEVEGLSEAAQVLGIADTTLKFHLGNIYVKTGVNRLTGLIRLMAGFSNPLLD